MNSVSRILTLAVVVSVVMSAAAFGAEGALPDPAKPGALPVGVTTILFVDHSRTDATLQGPRAMMTEIWYPATDDSRGLPKNKFSHFFLNGRSPELIAALGLGFKINLEKIDTTFKNFAVRDARVRDGVYPLIVFSHGNGGMRCQNAFWCEHMASHGYIVVSPDHTGNCAITTVDEVFVPYNGDRDQAAEDRPKDVSFLIDCMDPLNKGGDSRFLGKFDLEHIGVAGHSFGGYTAAAVADVDDRVDAIVPMAYITETRTNYTCPVMLLIASEDDTIGAEGNDLMRTYYDESKGFRYLVEFKNAGHYSFTEMYQLDPTFGDGVGQGTRITNGEPVDYIGMDKAFRLTNAYTTAFFGRFLKGQDGYEAYMTKNHDEGELIVKHGAPEGM